MSACQSQSHHSSKNTATGMTAKPELMSLGVASGACSSGAGQAAVPRRNQWCLLLRGRASRSPHFLLLLWPAAAACCCGCRACCCWVRRGTPRRCPHGLRCRFPLFRSRRRSRLPPGRSRLPPRRTCCLLRWGLLRGRARRSPHFLLLLWPPGPASCCCGCRACCWVRRGTC